MQEKILYGSSYYVLVIWNNSPCTDPGIVGRDTAEHIATMHVVNDLSFVPMSGHKTFWFQSERGFLLMSLQWCLVGAVVYIIDVCIKWRQQRGQAAGQAG